MEANDKILRDAARIASGMGYPVKVAKNGPEGEADMPKHDDRPKGAKSARGKSSGECGLFGAEDKRPTLSSNLFIKLSETDHERWKLAAKTANVSLAEYVRRVVNDYTDRFLD